MRLATDSDIAAKKRDHYEGKVERRDQTPHGFLSAKSAGGAQVTVLVLIPVNWYLSR